MSPLDIHTKFQPPESIIYSSMGITSKSVILTVPRNRGNAMGSKVTRPPPSPQIIYQNNYFDNTTAQYNKNDDYFAPGDVSSFTNFARIMCVPRNRGNAMGSKVTRPPPSPQIIYQNNYFDNTTAQYNKNDDYFAPGDVSSFTNFARIMCALLLRCGFIMIQASTTPTDDVYLIIQYNIADICLAILSYLFIGYPFAFGRNTIGGIIGMGHYIWEERVSTAKASLGLSACLIGTAIIGTYVIGRVRVFTMFVINVVFAAFFQPMLMHICWTSQGLFNNWKINDFVFTVKDYRGALVIFVPAAVIGVMSVCCLGRRLVRIDDLDDLQTGNAFVTANTAGYFFILIGCLALNLPAHTDETPWANMILLNSLVSMAATVIVVSLVSFFLNLGQTLRYSLTIRYIQSAIAGVVIVVSGVNIYGPFGSLLIGFAGGILFHLISIMMYYSAIDDPCNCTATYFAASAIGFLFQPFIAGIKGNNIGFDHPLEDFAWQFACIILVSVATVILFGLIIIFCYTMGCFKSQFEIENHQRANWVEKHLPKRPRLGRLFHMRDQETAPMEPSRKRRHERRRHQKRKKRTTFADPSPEDEYV